VIFKYENGQKLEPIEHLVINVVDDLAGSIIEQVANRK